MQKNIVLPAGVRNITARVLSVGPVEVLNQAGYISFECIDLERQVMVIQTFMLGEQAIKNTMNSLAIWVNALVRNKEGDDQIVAPDFRALKIIAEMNGGELDTAKARQEFLQMCIDELRTLIGKDIHISQTTNEAINQHGQKRTYRNYQPYPYGSTRPGESKSHTPDGNVAGYLG